MQDRYEIKAFAPDGSLVRIVRRDDDPRKTTQADLDEYFARQVAGRPAEVQTRMLSMVRDMPLVDSYPAFEEIVGDRAGHLWVREYRMFGEGDAVWTVFDPDGRIQGLVETPPGLDVFEIGVDYVLGSTENELGVEYVQLWPLTDALAWDDRGPGTLLTKDESKMSDSNNIRLATTILVLSLGNAGCEGPGGTAGPGLNAAMRDSAGITIVENSRPAPDSRLPWEIGAQPSLSIGSVASGGADELFRVTDAIRLEDGRIVVANLGTNELKVFGPDGSHAGTWGRQGEGPGEFTAHGPTAVAHWPGDSVAAVDAPYSPGLPIFDMNGNYGRDVALDATRGGILDVLPDGRMVSQGSQVFNRMAVFETTDLVRTETEWSVLDVDGTLYASLGRLPYGEAYFSELWGGDMQHPFQRRTVGAVWGDLVAVGVQTGYEIKAFAADGSLVRIVRRDWDSRSPTQAEYDERAPWGVPPVDAYPAFGEILSDRAGYLWVQEYRVSGEGALVWTVFDPEGRVQGLVETPAGLDVFEIGEEYVLGLMEDELGVEYVQLWALDRGVG